MYSIRDISEYLVVMVYHFAKHYSISEAEAFRYLNRYGAIRLTHEYYDVMHTQPIEEMIRSLTIFCQRKGGELK